MAVANPLFSTEAFTAFRNASTRMRLVIFYFLWEVGGGGCHAAGSAESSFYCLLCRRSRVGDGERGAATPVFNVCAGGCARLSMFVCNSATARGPCETSSSLI